jgi:broad specificity phosphatase PhoE
MLGVWMVQVGLLLGSLAPVGAVPVSALDLRLGTRALAVGALATRDSRLASRDSTVVIYVVRHAEKVDDSQDPQLSEAGKQRAERLADLLQDAGITVVWSTEYQRTLATAAPLASRLGLKVQAYHPGDLAAFAAILLRTPGRHLVVGHSNTNPALVQALGGEPHDAIKDTEYDRLYTIVASDGQVTTMLLRYGGSAR